MKNKKQDRALQAPAEANRDKHINFLAEEEGDVTAGATGDETVEARHDAEDGDSGPADAMGPKEIRIDPGFDHPQRTDADDKIFDDDIERAPLMMKICEFNMALAPNAKSFCTGSLKSPIAGNSPCFGKKVS